MLNFKRFVSIEAIVIYLVILILSTFSVIYIGNDNNKILLFSIIINVISFVGFLVTLNQIISWKENSKNTEDILNKRLNQYFKTALFQDFIMKSHVLETTEKCAINCEWHECLTNLRIILRLIDELEVINEKYNLDIGIAQIDKFRKDISVCCSSIENNMKYNPDNISPNSITKKIRLINSVIHSKITYLKTTLS